MTTITKRYTNLKAAHRQWRHSGHCALVHGECWSFDITISCAKPDICGFVVDFGKLRAIRNFLDEAFDHTLLIDMDDPQLPTFQMLAKAELVKLTVVPSCSAEGLAKYVAEMAQTILNGVPELRERGVTVTEVTCFEDEKNSAKYLVGCLQGTAEVTTG